MFYRISLFFRYIPSLYLCWTNYVIMAILLVLLASFVASASADCLYTPGTPVIRDIQLMSKAGGNWPIKIGGFTHTPLRVQYVRGDEKFILYNIWTAPAKSTTAKCKSNAKCAPMNKWFWVEGHSANLALGKDGKNIDPNLRRFIALNVEVNHTKGTSGNYVWRLDCNKCSIKVPHPAIGRPAQADKTINHPKTNCIANPFRQCM
eukprot:sb/3470450/